MKNATRFGMLTAAVVLSSLLLAACADRLAPAPRAAPPTSTVQAVAAQLAAADLERGQQVYFDKQCVACHNATGTGGIGKSLAGTTLPFDDFLDILRNAVPPKPAFNEAELPKQDAYDVYSWLKSLEDGTGASKAEKPQLASGKVLGMTMWVQGRCDTCHGAFAQGSAKGSPLAGISGTYEQAIHRMRASAGSIPGHAAGAMDDATFQRLYQWLKEGANPDGGC